MQFLKITRARFEAVHKDISDGSEPALRFYLLVAVSTLIASFGLITNSTAVVIGAMLVAPLMTPIFGICLALVRGESGLMGRAAQAEIVGVTAAVTMGFVLGSLLGDFDPTSEMLSRTSPNLFDLMVAVLAGFAGAYALVDEKISPALPGVAIATAIVPPLANAGLCLSLGEIRGGLGSFLLFFANFLSILIVGSATFILSGMAKRYGAQAKTVEHARRFGLPIVLFVLIAVFLGHSLVKIFEEQRVEKTIQSTLIGEFSQMPATMLNDAHSYVQDGRVNVMAGVHTPGMLTPTQVAKIQLQLTKNLGMPAELIVHCILSNYVSAAGSVKNVLTPKLDGTFVRSSDNEVLNVIASSEQVIREHFAVETGLDLERVQLLNMGKQEVLLANVLGIRALSREEIGLLENRIREATGHSTIELVFSTLERTMKDTEGPIRYGWILGDKATPEIRASIHEIRSDLSTAFARDEAYELLNVNATLLDEKLHFLLEITGSEVYPRQKVEKLQARLAEKFSQPIGLYAWSRIEVVHGPQGYTTPGELRQRFDARQKENLPTEIPLLLEASE